MPAYAEDIFRAGVKIARKEWAWPDDCPALSFFLDTVMFMAKKKIGC